MLEDAAQEQLCLVLEFVDGLPASKLVEAALSETGRGLEEPLAAQLVSQVLAGLEHLSRANVVYRDLKPDNMLVDRSGIVKLIDFGTAARLEPPSRTRRYSSVGTPWYVAPEVILGEGHDQRCDVWSLGCSALEFLLGHPPFHDLNALAALARMADYDPDLPPSPPLSRPARSFLERCIQRDLARRAYVAELLTHPWLQTAAPSRELARFVLRVSLLLAPSG
jgi:serine/threonine protein kinase